MLDKRVLKVKSFTSPSSFCYSNSVLCLLSTKGGEIIIVGLDSDATRIFAVGSKRGRVSLSGSKDVFMSRTGAIFVASSKGGYV